MNKILVIVISAFAVFFIGLKSNIFAHDDVKHIKKEASTATSYSIYIKPIFVKKCLACHGEESPEHHEFETNMKKYLSEDIGPRMDNYTYMTSFIVWPGTGTLMRRLDDGQDNGSGKPGNMYQYLGDTEGERQDNLKVFKSWVGNWSLKTWDQTLKEDINIMLLRY